MTRAQTAVEQYLRAIEAAETIRKAAVSELKTIINERIGELNAFGFTYKLTNQAQPASEKVARKPYPRRKVSRKAKHCEICNITGHDLRNHRNQEPKKKFSPKELAAKGLPTA